MGDERALLLRRGKTRCQKGIPQDSVNSLEYSARVLHADVENTWCTPVREDANATQYDGRSVFVEYWGKGLEELRQMRAWNLSKEGKREMQLVWRNPLRSAPGRTRRFESVVVFPERFALDKAADEETPGVLRHACGHLR